MALCCKSVLLANTFVAEPQSRHPDRGIVRLQIPKSMSKEFARTSIKNTSQQLFSWHFSGERAKSSWRLVGSAVSNPWQKA